MFMTNWSHKINPTNNKYVHCFQLLLQSKSFEIPGNTSAENVACYSRVKNLFLLFSFFFGFYIGNA